MAIFKTNFEVIYATEEEVKKYYENAAKEINLLLKKYDIRNSKGDIEDVCANKLRALLSFSGFLQFTPIKSIFFDQKQQFVPQEIIQAFHSIISDSPLNIKAIFLDTFIILLMKNGWDKPLSAYFEKQYNFPPDGIILLTELKDFSLGVGVYRATFQLRTSCREKISFFLKRSHDISSYNELLYFHLQKELLSTANYAKMPCRLLNSENKEELLLSPSVPGISSDTTLSILMQAYRKSKSNAQKFNLKKALEVLIETFISHAVLGDLLGRNDRHLMNSLIASVIDGIPQPNTLEDLNNPEKILAYANNIVINKKKAISLIDIDLKWLLEKKNAAWALADIDFGLSELNLLSLLTEFNDFNSKTNPFFEKRKEYVIYYYDVYCQTLENILEKKDVLLSAIKIIYPHNISEKKLKLLTQRINYFEKSREPIINLFKRYLLNFRIRLVYKATLFSLYRLAKKTNNKILFNALKEIGLLTYLPPQSTFITHKTSISLQLQCFRGVLSKQDTAILSKNDRITWEKVASNISMVAEKFNSKLFKALEEKKSFIKKDTAALLEILSKIK